MKKLMTEWRKYLTEEVDLPENVIQKIKAGDPLAVADYVASQNKSMNVNEEEAELVRDGLVKVFVNVYSLLKRATAEKNENAQAEGVSLAKTFIGRLYQADPSIKKKGYNPGVIGYGSGAYPRINNYIQSLDLAATKGYMRTGPNQEDSVGLMRSERPL